MADDVVLNPGADGVTAATDDIGGRHFQRIKVCWGADGTANDTAAANPMPVVQTGAMVPGTSASNLGKAEDAAHGSGDTGVLMLGVRRDTPAVGADTDGDNATLNLDANGRLYTVVVGEVDLGTAAQDALDAIQAAVEGTLVVDGSGVTQPISHAALTELAAAINGSSQVDVNIAASGATVPVSNAGLTALNGAIAGSEVQVDVLTMPALPAGNNNIGDVDAIQSGTWNIGTVTTVTTVTTVSTVSAVTAVGTVTPGTAQTSLGKAEDAAHGSTDVGVMALAVRRDTPAVGSDTDGDYSTFNVDSAGRLHVNNSTLVDDAQFTAGTSRVQPIGLIADEGSTDSVNEDDIGAPRMTLDRKQITTPYVHAAAGGATPYKNLDCDETEDDIKTSAGKLFWVHCINLSNAKRYLKFYNATAANTTVGTTVPVLTFPIPTMGDTNGAGFTINFGDMGVQFDTAICVAATTGFADNDSGAPGANEIILNAGYA